MKVLFSSYRNPHFITITEYIENALKKAGCQISFFDNANFIIPGRVRERLPILNNFDLKRINKNLIYSIKSLQPDLFFEAGGHRIIPDTIHQINKLKIQTALWTIDPPIDFKPIIEAAPFYGYVFTGGSEAYDILKNRGIKNLHFLPFACDPAIHRFQKLTEEEVGSYSCDVAFVGTVDPDLYPLRVKTLESISDFNIAVWGPGSNRISHSSSLKKHIRGEKTNPEAWTKIYSASKIVLCMHYNDPDDRIPCHQASPRVFEALACGAFVICDNQRDVFDLFNDGEHLVCFNDSDDLITKIKHYLESPAEREKIAEQGKKEVLKKHTYIHRIKTLLSVIGNA